MVCIGKCVKRIKRTRKESKERDNTDREKASFKASVVMWAKAPSSVTSNSLWPGLGCYLPLPHSLPCQSLMECANS